MPPRRGKPKVPGVETVERKHRATGQTYYRYRVRWTDPLTATKASETFDTSGEALDFKAELRRARRRGGLEDLDRGRELLADFANRWLEDWGAINLDRRTLRNYVSAYNNHLHPRVGHLQLRQITPRVVDKLRQDLEADAVGPGAIRKALSVLQGMMRQAIVWGDMTANPVKEVRKPAARRVKVIVPPGVTVVEAILANLTDPAHRMLVELLAYGAARPQDALALPWEHVGERRLVYADKHVDGVIVRGAKTGGENARSVEMLRTLESDLRHYRLAQHAGARLVVERRDGKPWGANEYKNWMGRASGKRLERSPGAGGAFAKAAAAAGFPEMTPYYLRHAYASLRIAEHRLSLKEIADELGHSVAELSRTYAHVIGEYRGLGPVDPDVLIERARHPQEATG